MVLPSRLAGLTLLAGLTTTLPVKTPQIHHVSGPTCSYAPTFLRQGTQANEPKITVVYQDSDIRNVLAAFAMFAGRTIRVGKEVQGSVTAELRDQPWDVAMQSILVTHQLAASEDQYGIITVDICKQ